MQAALDLSRPGFELLSISDIIPVEAREGYAAAGGEVLWQYHNNDKDSKTTYMSCMA